MTTLVTNNAFGVLASAITNVSGSIALQSGQGSRFPAPGTGEQAYITLIAPGSGVMEIVKYTSRTGDTFTGLTRGSDGTTAMAFAAGDAVELRIVAATYTLDGIAPNQSGHNGQFIKSVSGTAQWAQIVVGDVSGLGSLATQNGTFSGTHSGNSSGTNTGDQTIALVGDVTGSGTGTFTATIGPNKVLPGMLAQIASGMLLGRVTAGTGNVEVVTPTAISPAYTGEVTKYAGANNLTISANVVTMAKIQQIASGTFLGRATAGTGNVETLSAAQLKAALSINISKYTIAVPTVVGDAIDICQVTNPDFSANVDIWYTTASSGFAHSKRYFCPLGYGGTGGAWHKMLPIATSGPYAGQDVEIDVMISGSFATFRIRRTLGTGPGTANVTVMVGGEPASTFVTGLSGTYTGASAAAVYAPTVLVQRSGKVGINTDDPQYGLDLVGNFHATGQAILDAGLYSYGTVTAPNLSGSASGTNTGDQTITLTGDVTGSGTGSFAATIAANAVTPAKMAQVGTQTFLGRITGGPGNVEVISATQAKSILSIAQADVAGLTTSSTPTFDGLNVNNDIYATKVTAGYLLLDPAITTVGGTLTLDFNNGQSQILTLNAASTVSAINNVPTGSIIRLVFILGAYNITSWPASVKWVGGTAPALNSGAAKRAIVVLENDGTYLLASSAVY